MKLAQARHFVMALTLSATLPQVAISHSGAESVHAQTSPVRTWPVPMKRDMYAEVLLSLRVGSAELTVRGPDGQVLLDEPYDAEHTRGARGWISRQEGIHRVELRFSGPRVTNPYTVTLASPRAKQESDERRLGAQRLDDALAREEHHAHEGEAAEPWRQRNRDLVASYHDLGDPQGEAVALTRLALTLDDQGESAQAVERLEQALALSRGRGFAEAEALNWLGLECIQTGDYQRALAYLQQGLPVARAAGSRPLVAALLGNLGTLYGYLKEERQSIRYNKEALALSEHAHNPNTLAVVHNLGVSYLSLGEPARALPYFQRALAGWRANRDRVNLGPTLTALALLYRAGGRTEEALRALSEALPLVKEAGNHLDEIATLVQLGATYAERHEPERAREEYEAADALLQTQDRSTHPYVEWWVPLGFAQLAADRGDFAEARKWLDGAVAVVEASRASLGSRDLRAMYFASTRAVYVAYVDVLMQQHAKDPAAGFDRTALEASERARARTLLEMLTSAQVNLDQGLSPERAEQARVLYATLDAKANLQMRKLQSGDAAVGQALDRDIQQIAAELELVEARIREVSSQYGSIAEPTPITAGDIQELLDPDTVLLEYSIGDKRSYLWVVTRESIESHTLPAGKPIESLARRLHTLVTARNRPGGGSARLRLARRAAAEREYHRAAARLGQMLLGSVGRPAGKRIVVAADGALHYVPFAALPQPAAWRGAATAGEPLIVDYEVVNLPSAAVIGALRRELGARPRAAKRMFVFADPVFEADDSRLSAPQPRSGGESVPGSGFPRLAYTRRLAEQATRDLPPGEGATAVDFEASRATAMSARLADYRTVMFATHGVLNNEYPELSGVVLSLVGRSGEPQNGFLRLHDVYGLKLNADAVVLGACETGLGKEMKGEGLVGLSRGFMYAGARRVVATLWKVDEEATVELLGHMVQAADRDGKPYAEALREAQLEVRRESRWRSPYYWAGVTLQGEWR
jgi:CHAT domain-containing protein/tetratricopeptide (TPR) repeat protein